MDDDQRERDRRLLAGLPRFVNQTDERLRLVLTGDEIYVHRRSGPKIPLQEAIDRGLIGVEPGETEEDRNG